MSLVAPASIEFFARQKHAEVLTPADVAAFEVAGKWNALSKYAEAFKNNLKITPSDPLALQKEAYLNGVQDISVRGEASALEIAMPAPASSPCP